MKILIPDNVSTKTNVFDILKERGFIEQCTHEDEIRDMLGNEKIKFYIGFDPTADSLHIGHFMQIIIMLYMQKFGHTPVVLTGGDTGMVANNGTSFSFPPLSGVGLIQLDEKQMTLDYQAHIALNDTMANVNGTLINSEDATAQADFSRQQALRPNNGYALYTQRDRKSVV